MKMRSQSDQVLLDDLLERVESIKHVLEADASEAEVIGRLPLTSVDALRRTNLYDLKTAKEAGGFEASPAVQQEVFERVAYYSPSAGWNLFISCAGAGLASAFLSDEAFKEVFPGDVTRTFTSGGGYVPGRLVPVEGGYLLSGKWIYGSGIDHADYSLVPAKIEGSDGMVSCVVPTREMTIFSNWDVVGLKGSGSSDYSVDDLFVPDAFVYNRMEGQKRGGGLYRMGLFGYVSVEIAGFMLGVAQRALDEFVAISRNKSRGYGEQSSMKGQPVVLKEIAVNDLKLKAARALNLEVSNRADEIVADGSTLPPEMEAEMRAAALFVAETTIEVVDAAVRYSGGSAIKMQSPLQRCLRDIHVAGTHFVVAPTSYEGHGEKQLNLIAA